MDTHRNSKALQRLDRWGAYVSAVAVAIELLAIGVRAGRDEAAREQREHFRTAYARPGEHVTGDRPG